MSIYKHKVFFYINLILKILISIFGIFQTRIFNNPLSLYSISVIAGAILWFSIIFCERKNEYQKFRNYYIINFIAEFILTLIFCHQTIFGPKYVQNLYISGRDFMGNVWVLFFFIFSMITSITGIIYFFLKRTKYKLISKSLEKLKEILSVSDRIKLKRLQKILNLDDNSFNEKIIEWAKTFGFKIDGEFLITQKESISDFIEELDKKFIEWEKTEKDKTGKF
ncbi:MAG: hypothetical protein ACFFAN_07975 [Promethearchaeota archaeon]